MVKYGTAMRVKNLARTGWMLRGIPPSDSETVSSHIFEVVFLSMLIADKLGEAGVRTDVLKIVRMALLHDILEGVTGDIAKNVKDSIANPAQLEEEAVRELEIAGYSDILKELSEGRSLESVIVKLCDNVATLLQGIRYLNKGYTSVLDIVESTKEKVETILESAPVPDEAREVLKNLITKLVVSEEL